MIGGFEMGSPVVSRSMIGLLLWSLAHTASAIDATARLALPRAGWIGDVFDGSPADVVPSLLDEWGVSFSWLDTSLEERGFRVFRSSASDPTDSYGTLIADVRSTSTRPTSSTATPARRS